MWPLKTQTIPYLKYQYFFGEINQNDYTIRFRYKETLIISEYSFVDYMGDIIIGFVCFGLTYK